MALAMAYAWDDPVSSGRSRGMKVSLAGTLLLCAQVASAFPAKLTSSGKLDFVYGSTVESGGGPATGYKPESKLFFTADERWWAILGTSSGPSGAGIYLYGLDSSHAWQPELRLPGADLWAKADTLLDGTTLYVALRDNRSVSGNPRVSQLYRIAYLGDGDWGTPEGPFPITTKSPETLTIALDSDGRLWTTFESSLEIRVGHTAPGGTSFTFTSLPTTDVDGDDIASVVAFGTSTSGHKIGVFWSDQVAKRDWFAWRNDGDPIVDGAWHIETAFGAGVGGCPTSASSLCADDHIDVKTLGDDLYAAIKTSHNDASSPNANDPLIELLHRDARGSWSAFPVSPVSQGATRPIVLLAPALDAIWIFAAKGSSVVAWQSSLADPGFDSAASTTWAKSSAGSIANPTSTKQVITGSSGAVVETSQHTKYTYFHNEFLP